MDENEEAQPTSHEKEVMSDLWNSLIEEAQANEVREHIFIVFLFYRISLSMLEVSPEENRENAFRQFVEDVIRISKEIKDGNV